MAHISGKLTKVLVRSLGPGRHADGNGLYLVVDPSGARRWVVRATIKGQKNRAGKPLRTDFGLGGADLVTIHEARARALEYRRLARAGLHPKYHGAKDIPSFEEVARQVHIDRLPSWKNAKHGAQFITTLETYAFPKIGRLPVDAIGQPEVLAVLSPIWTEKHETARRVSQRIKTVLDVARSKGFREGENPVTAIRDGGVLPKVKARPKHHTAMDWRDVPELYAGLAGRSAMAAKALMLTCLTGARTSEVLGMRWEEIDTEARLWTCPPERMKGGEAHRVPLTDEMLAIIEPLREMQSEYVFEGQKRHRPLSNMAMLMLLRRMNVEGVTVHGFRSTFRDWASEVANAPREIAEMSLSHRIGSAVGGPMRGPTCWRSGETSWSAGRST
ncbi:tyrosine-type recombinase/integrase [Roseivivax sediminis]|uniref:Integrase n=1 Tax=Roseivivax sediminis TaxID=936889 RepID=A0A1I1VWP2_9RHOB|nr:site-specific integrase [Roseivivax sediminis]SFD85020.1 Integrase [Roseivivax sediminis]